MIDILHNNYFIKNGIKKFKTDESKLRVESDEFVIPPRTKVIAVEAITSPPDCMEGKDIIVTFEGYSDRQFYVSLIDLSV